MRVWRKGRGEGVRGGESMRVWRGGEGRGGEGRGGCEGVEGRGGEGRGGEGSNTENSTGRIQLKVQTLADYPTEHQRRKQQSK